MSLLAALLARLGGGWWGGGDRRAVRPRAVVRRGLERGLPYLAVTLDVPAAAYPQAARALAGSAAEVCACHRGTVGSVTVVAGEEPALVSLAPQRDAVANRVLGVLLAGESHRAPHLLLLLAPGVYLAQVVDPYAPLEATLDTVAGMLAARRVSLAVRLTVRPRRDAVEVEMVVVAGDRHTLGRTFAAARDAARALRSERRASGAAAAASTVLNTRLQA